MKALAICTCAECRHYQEDYPVNGILYARCRVINRRFESDDDLMPTWCPLPDMPEVEE